VRPQRGVGFDSVVESVDQGVNRGVAADARKDVAANERPMRLRMSQKSTALHSHILVTWCRDPLY
jgi:hypothetical protein